MTCNRPEARYTHRRSVIQKDDIVSPAKSTLAPFV